jgi:hypothetical protein
VICVGTYDKYHETWDDCADISYYGNCIGEYVSDRRYCNATINVRFRSRCSRRVNTWAHSRECF